LCVPELGPAIEDEVRSRLGLTEADAFLARLEQLSFDIFGPLSQLYGDVVEVGEFATELVRDALRAAAERPAELRRLDRRREIDPGWFQRSRVVGYVWPTGASTSCGWTRRRSCGSGWAPTARTSPRRTCSSRRSAR
jgi:hypothetical protein